MLTIAADLQLFWTAYDPLNLASGSIDVLGISAGIHCAGQQDSPRLHDAHHYRRTGHKIAAAFKSAINAGLRRGLIERDGPVWIRKVQ